MKIGMNTGLEGTRRIHDTAIFSKNVLENGVIVWLQEKSILLDEEGIVAGVLVDIGSQMETMEEFGVAHFFEHMYLRGTKNNPTQEKLLQPIESIGGIINANTSITRTFFSVRAPKDNFILAIETLYQMIVEPLLREDDIKTEKSVILNEHRRFYSNGNNVRGREFLKSFAGDHLGHHTIGKTSDIRKISRDSLRNFHEKHYHGGNLHIICGGSFSYCEDILEKINQIFSLIKPGEKSQFPIDPSFLLEKSGNITLQNPDFKKDSLLMIFPIPKPSFNDDVMIDFLVDVISGGSNSPLFLELREKRGWVYETGFCISEYMLGNCFFSFVCSTERKNFEEVEKIFYSCLTDLKNDYIIERKKTKQLRRKLSFNNPLSVCTNVIGDILLHNKISSHQQIAETIDAITLEDVFKWRDYLLEKKPFVARMII